MPCPRCETLPVVASDGGELLITAAMPELLETTRRFVERHGLMFRKEPQVLHLPDVDFPAFLALLRDSKDLDQAMRRELLALLLQPGERLHFGLFARARSLEHWVGLQDARELTDMLHAQRLTTWFQPIVDATTLSILGYECLLRGLTTDGKPILPGGLLQAALNNDLLHVLDRQARESALTNAARQHIERHLFINFMPRVIYDPHCCLRSTIALIERLGLKPEQIVFEVVEYERLDDIAHLRGIFEVYREAGYRIALDDLGSGYSTLNMMAELKPDIIKIDRALICDCDRDRHKRSVIRALIDAAHALDSQVVAEGIERSGELECVRAAGADLVQGYLFARPAPIPLAALASTSC